MDNQTIKPITNQSFRKITLILSEQQCNRFMTFTKTKKFCKGIIFIGRESVNNHTLNILGIKSQKKMLIHLLIPTDKVDDVLTRIVKEFKIDRPGHGVAYVTKVSAAGYTDNAQLSRGDEKDDLEESSMYRKLTVIVNRGNADDVIDIARRAGANGGTILHGRGTGSECAAKLFGIEIEPEKELVIILLPSSKAEKVIDSLCSEFRFEEQGNGIIFVEPVLDVRGLVEGVK